MCILGPRPALMQRKINLAVQKRDDELLQIVRKTEFRLKKIALIEWATKACALVALIEMPVGNRVDPVHEEGR